jgi:hypothetical protein
MRELLMMMNVKNVQRELLVKKGKMVGTGLNTSM